MSINIMTVGLGPYAQRLYLPAIQKMGKKYNAEIKIIVELQTKDEVTKTYLRENNISAEAVFVESFDKKMPTNVESKLNDIIAKSEEEINGVIISTEPSVHKPYALWALEHGYNILMDKPITARKNAVFDINEAYGIFDDYQELLNAYQALQIKKETIFSISVQRRYHPAFQKILDLITEVRDKTGCPISTIHSMHADGQWRMPDEIVDVDYHGYKNGYGKVSHTGYHSLDIIHKLLKAGEVEGKAPEQAEIYSSFILPQSFLSQVTESDYVKLFGKDYVEGKKYSSDDLIKLTQSFGEVDAQSQITLKRGGENMTLISLQMLHNSCSMRSWLEANHGDLYKGNGRVKHETHTIHQGPFQSIHLHSFQQKENSQKENEAFIFGGSHHYDIHVFRNPLLNPTQSHELITMSDLYQNDPKEIQLIMDETRDSIVEEFLAFMNGDINKKNAKSNIDDHLIPAKLMSGIYASHIRKTQGREPVVIADLNERTVYPR